jgi:probable HAF family extracellular repeat protein
LQYSSLAQVLEAIRVSGGGAVFQEAYAMKTFRQVLRVAMLLPTCILVASAASAPELTFKFTNFTVKRAPDTLVLGINNSGIMVGQYLDRAGMAHGFLLKSGSVTVLNDPNGTSSACYGINKAGDVVGSYTNASGAKQAFLLHGKNFTDIGPMGALESEALGINDQGHIVGYFMDPHGNVHGFMWDGKQYLQLDYPGAKETLAYGINNSGMITVGWLPVLRDRERAALYSGGKFTLFNVPGALSSVPHGIDSAGDVVFSWADSSGNPHGSLLRSGSYFDFNDPSGRTFAWGINDHNVIVGFCGSVAGFKATYQ